MISRTVVAIEPKANPHGGVRVKIVQGKLTAPGDFRQDVLGIHPVFVFGGEV